MTGLLILLVLGTAVYAVVRSGALQEELRQALRNGRATDDQIARGTFARSARVCSQCGYIGAPKRGSDFSFLVFLILILFFILPGLIYWAVTRGRYAVCAACRARNTMLPLDSPRGRTLVDAARQQIGVG